MSPPSLRSTTVLIDGLPVHVADYGGDPTGPTVLCVHGLGGSHANWRSLASQLVGRARVLAVDLPGHGRTPRMGRSAAVAANRHVMSQVLARTFSRPVHLVGHSMGASISLLQAGAEPESVTGLTLIAPPLPRASVELPTRLMATQVALCTWPWLARRTMTRRLQRSGAERWVEIALQRTCVSPELVDPATRELLVELVATRASGHDAEAAFVEAARSIGLLVARSASYRRAIAAVCAPTLVVHGSGDRLLRHSAASRLAQLQPSWRLELIEGVGHSPHMEAPTRTADAVLGHVTTARQPRPLRDVLG